MYITHRHIYTQTGYMCILLWLEPEVRGKKTYTDASDVWCFKYDECLSLSCNYGTWR